MKRRFAMAAVLAVMCVLPSIIFVAAEDIPIGGLISGKKPKNTWLLEISYDIYTSADIETLDFYCEIDGDFQPVPCEWWPVDENTIGILLDKKSIPKTCEYTFVSGTLDDTNTFWATGPGYLKRKWT